MASKLSQVLMSASERTAFCNVCGNFLFSISSLKRLACSAPGASENHICLFRFPVICNFCYYYKNLLLLIVPKDS